MLTEGIAAPAKDINSTKKLSANRNSEDIVGEMIRDFW
jgi:hypothetical protein